MTKLEDITPGTLFVCTQAFHTYPNPPQSSEVVVDNVRDAPESINVKVEMLVIPLYLRKLFLHREYDKTFCKTTYWVCLGPDGQTLLMHSAVIRNYLKEAS